MSPPLTARLVRVNSLPHRGQVNGQVPISIVLGAGIISLQSVQRTDPGIKFDIKICPYDQITGIRISWSRRLRNGLNVGCLGRPAALISSQLVLDRLAEPQLLEGSRSLNVAAVEEEILSVRRSALGQNEAETAVADQTFNNALCHVSIVLSSQHQTTVFDWSSFLSCRMEATGARGSSGGLLSSRKHDVECLDRKS